MYYTRILRISDADYMGQGTLGQEGVPTAVAMFLVGLYYCEVRVDAGLYVLSRKTNLIILRHSHL